MKSEKTDLFLRDSTGLVKKVSLLDAVSLNMGNMAAGALLGSIGSTLVLVPTISGLNLVYSSVLSFLLVVPQIVVYSIMSRKISRTGGDYVWTSRTLGPQLGGSLSMMGVSFESIAFLALVLLSVVFSIGSVAVFFGDGGALALALPGGTSGANSVLQFAVGAIILTLLIAVNTLRPKLGIRIISAAILIGVFGLLLAVGVLLMQGRSGVETYMASLGNSSLTYNSVTSSYSHSGLALAPTVFMVPFFAIFAYPWFNAGAAVGSELKGKSAVNWNVPLAAIITFVLITGSLAAMYLVAGVPFVNAAFANSNLVFNFSFNFWTLAMGVANNFVVSLIIGICWILWSVAIVGTAIIFVSRYMVAYSFDRIFPSQVAYVSPRFGSPVVANMIIYVIALGLLAGATVVYGSFAALYGIYPGSMIYFAAVGAGAIIYGNRSAKGSSKRLLIVFGALEILAFAYLAYAFLASPGVWGGNPLAYGFSAGSFLVGVVSYYVSKRHYMKRGMDISMQFKEIPPE